MVWEKDAVLTLRAGAACSVFETYHPIEILKFKIVRPVNALTYKFYVCEFRNANTSISEEFVGLRESRDPK